MDYSPRFYFDYMKINVLECKIIPITGNEFSRVSLITENNRLEGWISSIKWYDNIMRVYIKSTNPRGDR